MYFGSPLYWRETHKQPKLLIFDGRLVVLLLLVILHIRLWTLFLALLAMFILFFFERKGVPADSILRYLRTSFIGRRRTARGAAAERPAIDYGYESALMVQRERDALEIRKTRKSKVKTPKSEKKTGLVSGVSAR